MSYEESLRSITLNADATLAERTGVPGQPGSTDPNGGKLYRFVKVTGVRQVGLATAAADKVIGVMQSKPQVAGQAATVGIRGVTNVVVQTLPIAAGDPVDPGNAGGAVKSAGAGKGIALATAATVGELIPVLLTV